MPGNPATAAVARWFEQRLTAFDLETTAADPEIARIVTGCVVHVGGAELTRAWTWMVKPDGYEIPAEATAIHGITTAKALADGQPAATVLAEIGYRLRETWGFDRPVVIFNGSYDLTVVDRELRRQAMSPLTVGPVVDPFVIDKHVDRYRRGKRTLATMCEHYGCKHDGAHDAAFDAIAAARLAYRIAKSVPAIGETPLARLHELQAAWYAEQADGLEQYFARTGKPRTCNREWPIRVTRTPAHSLEVG